MLQTDDVQEGDASRGRAGNGWTSHFRQHFPSAQIFLFLMTAR
jgi:hypothetical protein